MSDVQAKPNGNWGEPHSLPAEFGSISSLKSQNPAQFEGCGLEGPLIGIFYAKFDPEQGPVIITQVGCESDHGDSGESTPLVFDFEALSTYLIPKQQLGERQITVNYEGVKIMGRPVVIQGKQYKRNQFLFNVSFVCHTWSKTAHLEAALRKLGSLFCTLEEENHYLSEMTDISSLTFLLKQVLTDLNAHDESTLELHGYTLRLKIVRAKVPPLAIQEYQVPVFRVPPSSFRGEFDLTTRKIVPYVDGASQVSRIAFLSEVDVDLAKLCIRDLVFKGIVTVLPVFLFRNAYCVTQDIDALRKDRQLLNDLKVCAHNMDICSEQKNSFLELYRFACALKHNTSVGEVCARLDPDRKLNPRRIISCLLERGIIKRLSKYPYCDRKSKSVTVGENSASGTGVPEAVLKLCDGNTSFDEICSRLKLIPSQLDTWITDDPNVQVLIKKE